MIVVTPKRKRSKNPIRTGTVSHLHREPIGLYKKGSSCGNCPQGKNEREKTHPMQMPAISTAMEYT